MLERGATYADLRARFGWRLPQRYNIGVDVCDRHAASGALALIQVGEQGAEQRFTFEDLRRGSNRFANVLAGQGLKRGDRVAVLLPQAPETALAHLAAFKAGMISVPLFELFGPDALFYRLADSGARALVTSVLGAEKIVELRHRLPALELGLRVFDAAVGGAGGCPYAPGAPGNVATGQVAALLAAQGHHTGLDLNRLEEAEAFMLKLLGRRS